MELTEFTGRSDHTKFRKSIINPLFSAGLPEMTEANSPKSPSQKYCTTENGKKKKQEYWNTMINGIKNQVDKLWTEFWINRITNPLMVIEQISFLMHARLLDI